MNIKKSWKEIAFFILLIAPATAIKIFYLNINKALWWDEAVFMLQAKHYVFGTVNTGWWAGKGFLLPVLLTTVGANELAAKILMLFFSTGVLLLVYLISKRFFDIRVAAVATIFSSFIWLDLFYTPKILSDIPSVFFALLAVYLLFFESKKHKQLPSILAGVFLLVAGMIRFNAWVLLPALAIALLFFERKKLLYLLLGFALMFGVYAAISFSMYGDPLYEPKQFFTANIGGQKIGATDFGTIFGSLPTSLSWPVVLLAFVGIALGFMHKKVIFLFVVSFAFLVPYLFAILFDLRYAMYIYPMLAVLGAFGLFRLLDKFKLTKFQILAAVAIAIFVAYLQIPIATSQLEGRADSYLEVKQSTEWMAANSLTGDIIMTASQPQVTYYSERQTVLIPQTEEEFNTTIEQTKPKYIMISFYETHPEYIQPALQDSSRFRPVLALAQPGTNNTVLIVFEYTPTGT